MYQQKLEFAMKSRQFNIQAFNELNSLIFSEKKELMLDTSTPCLFLFVFSIWARTPAAWKGSRDEQEVLIDTALVGFEHSTKWKYNAGFAA